MKMRKKYIYGIIFSFILSLVIIISFKITLITEKRAIKSMSNNQCNYLYRNGHIAFKNFIINFIQYTDILIKNDNKNCNKNSFILNINSSYNTLCQLSFLDKKYDYILNSINFKKLSNKDTFYKRDDIIRVNNLLISVYNDFLLPKNNLYIKDINSKNPKGIFFYDLSDYKGPYYKIFQEIRKVFS